MNSLQKVWGCCRCSQTKPKTTASQQTADSCLRFADRVGLLALEKGSNFVFSPLSVRAALSLAAAGSKGETLNQFLSCLGSPTVGNLNSTAERLLGSVRSSRSVNGGGSQLSFVNGMWVDRSIPLKESFQEIASSVYDAVAGSVDFKNQPQDAAGEVNLWVENNTNGLIKGLIPSNAVDHLTRVILANALYFKGIWAEKFDRSKTTNGSFHLLNGSSIQVPFMTISRNFSDMEQFIASFDGFQVLKLPYKPNQAGRDFSMLIFLPDSRDGLSNLVQKAVSSSSFFDTHVPTRRVDVGRFLIPKFKISAEFEASEVLQDLGLKAPFIGGVADFTEMVQPPTDGSLHISSVHHKATIEVGEEGTEASAATAVVARLLCYIPPVDFVADHPFMFAIREDQTGALLFLGHVVNPSEVET